MQLDEVVAYADGIKDNMALIPPPPYVAAIVTSEMGGQWAQPVTSTSTPTIIAPTMGQTVPRQFTVMLSPISSVYDSTSWYHEVTVMNRTTSTQVVYTTTEDTLFLDCEPGSIVNIKVRIVTSIGNTDYNEITVNVSGVTVHAVLSTGAINGTVTLPATFNVIHETIGAVDDHESTTWSVNDSQGNVVLSSTGNPNHRTSFVIPEGVLALNSTFTVHVTTSGALYGNATTSESFTTVGAKVLFAGLDGTTAETRSVGYSQSIDAFVQIPGGVMEEPDVAYTVVTFSPDSRFMLVGINAAPFMVIYERQGARYVKQVHTVSIPAAAAGGSFTADNKRLLITHNLGTKYTFAKLTDDGMYVPDDATMSPVPNVTGPMQFNPLGTHIVVAIPHPSTSSYHDLHLYVLNGNVYQKASSGHPSVYVTTVMQLAFSPDGGYLAIPFLKFNSGSGAIVLFKVTGNAYAALPGISVGGVYTTNCSFSADGLWLIGVAGDSKCPVLRIWEFDKVTGSVTMRLNYNCYSRNDYSYCSISPDSQYAAVVRAKQILIFKRDNLTWSLLSTKSHSDYVGTIQWYYE